MKRLLSTAIILSLVVGSMVSTVSARNTSKHQTLPGKMDKKTTMKGKKSNSSYYAICMDLLKKTEYKKLLTKAEKSVIKKYISKGKISSKKIHLLESAIKKHKCIVVKNPNKKKNLISSPASIKTGTWYNFKCDDNAKSAASNKGNGMKSKNSGGSLK